MLRDPGQRTKVSQKKGKGEKKKQIPSTDIQYIGNEFNTEEIWRLIARRSEPGGKQKLPS